MANFYLDVSAIGNEYQAYADTPTTWGVPQDGNGKAGPGHTAAVAIATIDCAVASASGLGQLSVLGATVSSTLTGSGATLAANIVSAINLYGTAVGPTYSALLLPLNKLVFARQNPTTTTTVEIMLRIAGTDWVGFTPAIAGTWDTAPTMTNFAGGANGPFAYFWNTTTVFGKAVYVSTGTYPTYGIAIVASAGVTNPAATDVIHIRSQRSGVNLTAGHRDAAAAYAQASILAHVYVVDAGAQWAGDNGQFTLSTYSTNTYGANSITFNSGCVVIAAAADGFRITHDGAITNGPYLNIYQPENGTLLLCNVLFEEGTGGVINFPSASNFYTRTCIGLHYKSKVGRNLGGAPSSNYAPFVARYIDCWFEYTTSCPTPSNLFVSPYYGISGGSDCYLELSNCKFTFISGGPITQLFPATSNFNSAFQVYISNCIGLKPDILPFPSGILSGNRRLTYVGCRDSVSGVSGRSFLADNGHTTVSWLDDGTFPYLNSVTPTGSGFASKATIKAGRSAYYSVNLLAITYLYRLADASATITVQLLVPATQNFNTSQMVLYGVFTDSSNTIRTFSTQASFSAAYGVSPVSLTASASTWTNQGALVAKKITFDTASLSAQIKQGTEIAVRVVYFGDTPTGADTSIFISPELELA